MFVGFNYIIKFTTRKFWINFNIGVTNVLTVHIESQPFSPDQVFQIIDKNFLNWIRCPRKRYSKLNHSRDVLQHGISVFWNTLKIPFHFSSIVSGTFLRIWTTITYNLALNITVQKCTFMNIFIIALITCTLSSKSEQAI